MVASCIERRCTHLDLCTMAQHKLHNAMFEHTHLDPHTNLHERGIGALVARKEGMGLAVGHRI